VLRARRARRLAVTAVAGLFDPFIERIRAWRGARPPAASDPRFRLSNITAQWRALLAD